MDPGGPFPTVCTQYSLDRKKRGRRDQHPLELRCAQAGGEGRGSGWLLGVSGEGAAGKHWKWPV